MLGWDWYRFDKKCAGAFNTELVFFIRWDLRVM
jgi:hypothetical protein